MHVVSCMFYTAVTSHMYIHTPMAMASGAIWGFASSALQKKKTLICWSENNPFYSLSHCLMWLMSLLLWIKERFRIVCTLLCIFIKCPFFHYRCWRWRLFAAKTDTSVRSPEQVVLVIHEWPKEATRLTFRFCMTCARSFQKYQRVLCPSVFCRWARARTQGLFKCNVSGCHWRLSIYMYLHCSHI